MPERKVKSLGWFAVAEEMRVVALRIIPVRFAGAHTDDIAQARNRSRGFTLVEVMVSVALTTVIALGTLCYQYHGVKHSRVAQAQVAATRAGQLVLEDWKSTGGDADYDPTSLGVGFVAPSSEEPVNCVIKLDNQNFYVQLVQNDIDQDTVAGVTLRQLRVLVKWRKDYERGELNDSDPTVVLTTYVRRDQD